MFSDPRGSSERLTSAPDNRERGDASRDPYFYYRSSAGERQGRTGASPGWNRAQGSRPDRGSDVGERERSGLGRPAPEQEASAPRASFAGPLGPAKLRVLTPQMRQQTQQALGSWVRQHNQPGAPGGRPLLSGVGGSVIPSGVRVIDRSTISPISGYFSRVRSVVGSPTHRFAFAPRTSFSAGFFTQTDGFYGFRHFRHRPIVVLDFFYPFYFGDPYWFAFYYPGYYPSIYSLWGWCPGWVYPTRVYYEPYCYYYPAPRYDDRYERDAASAERAINDIRHAWIEGDIKQLATHLTDQLDIRIYFEGKYSYTTSSKDYYAMTADTMATTQTVAMEFGDPVWIKDEVFYTGRQVFKDPEGERHTLYISYRLRRLGSDWYIVGFGSGTEPLAASDRDAR
jgi:hypothetical protein